MKRKLLPLLLTAIAITSCDVLNQVVTTVNAGNPSGGLTTAEVIEGLKTALIVGTDSSSNILHKTDGYFKDAAVKILLPPEARVIVDNANHSLLSAVGINKMIDNVILSMNRAAEDAAAEAAPIFKDAVRGMSFTDAWAILRGSNPADKEKNTSPFDSLAATHYLISTTYQPLYKAFSPKLNASLDKKLALGYSANQAWKNLTSSYNKVAGSVPGQLLGWKTVNTDLGNYATGKALDGLFKKVGDQERIIRRNPMKWAKTAVGNILKRVFGS